MGWSRGGRWYCSGGGEVYEEGCRDEGSLGGNGGYSTVWICYEVWDLNAQLQEKVFANAALKNELRNLKRKNVVDTVVSKPNATIALGMFKLDMKPISHRLQNNRDAHEIYINKTIENTDTLRGFTCLNSPKPSEKLVVVTPMDKEKRVRFAEPVTSSNNIPKQTDSLKIKDSNKTLLTSTGVKPTTSASGSKPSGRTFTIVGNRRPKATRSVGSNSKVKIVESKTSNSNEPKQSWGSTISDVSSSFLNDCRFGNDHTAKIMGYRDYQMGNVTISQVYYVEGLGHNLFSMGQFCDFDLKDEVLEFVIKFLKMIQVHLNAIVRNIRTDNGTEFVNQTLRDYYEEVRISHQTSVARTPQHNGIVERHNRTLVEAARTISGPGPKLLTPGTISSGLVPNIPSLTLYVTPTKNDWEILFQPMFDEYLNPPPCVDPQVLEVIAPKPAVLTDTPSSTIIDQDYWD
nr:integrase, catalytic region, zinc finger, CCHC-type, peptidase aspartic, catalytic [Tanacetum cinerariifolium]